jgi:hypothetical protein
MIWFHYYLKSEKHVFVWYFAWLLHWFHFGCYVNPKTLGFICKECLWILTKPKMKEEGWLFLGLDIIQILSKCGSKLKLHHSALGKKSKRGYLPLIGGMPPVVRLWALPYKNMPFESGNTYETLKCLLSILTPNTVKVLILSSTWRFQAKI